MARVSQVTLMIVIRETGWTLCKIHHAVILLVLRGTDQCQSRSCQSPAGGIRSCLDGSPCSSPSAAPSAGGSGC